MSRPFRSLSPERGRRSRRMGRGAEKTTEGSSNCRLTVIRGCRCFETPIRLSAKRSASISELSSRDQHWQILGRRDQGNHQRERPRIRRFRGAVYCTPVNDSIMELLILIDALKRASADRITAVIPYYGYARQDRKTRGREPITAKLVANLLTNAGANRVLAVDLHSGQIQGFFDIPVDHLTAIGILSDSLKDKDLKDYVVVSPDAGSIPGRTCRTSGTAGGLHRQEASRAQHGRGNEHRWKGSRPPRDPPR